MSIRLKIILAFIPLIAVVAFQTGVFYVQEGRFDALMLFSLLCALIIGGGGAFFLIRSIVPPLNRAVAILNAIAVGYLENAIDATGKSETDDLLRALAAMQMSQAEINDHLERQISETEVAYSNMEKGSAALNEANARLASLNASMNTMLDALDQGLFLFGADGICSNVSSKACLSLLGVRPAGLSVADVLRPSPGERESIDRLLKLVFSDAAMASAPDDLLALFPESAAESSGARISLAYHPIVDAEKRMQFILAVATDHSAEEEAIKLMHDREAEALRVLRISGNRNLFTQFYHSLTGFFSNLDEPLSSCDSLAMMRRDIHTFKGNASIFHLQDIVDLLHGMESRMATVSDVAQARVEIKADLPKLQAVLTKTHKQAYDILGRDFDQHGVTRTLPLSALGTMADRLKKLFVNDDLYRDFVETLMCEPVRKSLAIFDISLRELADRYGKKVSPCYFTGDNFLLLTENYQPLFASFSQIARNIINHAIDPPEVRAEQNKDPELMVIIETKKYKVGSQEWFRLSFEDDGCGLDVPLLRKRLAGARSEEEAARLTEMEVMDSIFKDGISTQRHVNELAGRGVGLSAVKYAAEKVGGKVAVESRRGVYTKIIIDAPINWSTP